MTNNTQVPGLSVLCLQVFIDSCVVMEDPSPNPNNTLSAINTSLSYLFSQFSL